VSLSLTLSRNEKVELHIRKKTYKPNALRFWVEGGCHSLMCFGFCLILVCLLGVFPSDFPNIFLIYTIMVDDETKKLSLKEKLMVQLETKDMGNLMYFLGIEVNY